MSIKVCFKIGLFVRDSYSACKHPTHQSGILAADSATQPDNGKLATSGVIVNALHPATYMDTAMVRRAGVTPMSTVEQGAEAIMQLAVSPAFEGRSGRYFNG